MNTQVDTNILFPVARIVQGDLYEAQTEDMQGNPLVTKQGPNQGKARVDYFFAIAIPKTGEQAWWLTQWGAKILGLAQSWWPQGQTGTPRFSWKIVDGDDATPNPEANMRRNCDREGFPGHWVVRVSSGFATKIFDEQGNPLLQPGLVKRGFWVEVWANVASNENAQKPGIYINHSMVAYRAPGKEIIAGPDPRQVGFGRSPLPAGVTAQPLPNTANFPAPGTPAMPGATPPMPMGGQNFVPPPAATPGMPPMPGAPSATPMYPAAPVAAPVPVMPQQNFLQPPGAGAMPPIPSAPMVAGPVPPAMTPPPPSVVCPLGAPMGYKMANPNGGRYEAFRSQGWNDAQLLQGGHMVRL